MVRLTLAQAWASTLLAIATTQQVYPYPLTFPVRIYLDSTHIDFALVTPGGTTLGPSDGSWEMSFAIISGW